jgi:DHA2 family multidrug resistance protein
VSVADEAGTANRTAITVCVILATVMNALDTTIANVALPPMQGSVSASADQITWVLTSYIVACAVGTPLTGWLVGRFGQKTVFMASVAGFTLASMLCGLADSLTQIVAFRLLQGLLGAPLIPLSQSMILDINPPAKHGQAMAVWGASTLVGPLMGPTIGGLLTQHLSWRWCFFINLPIGLITLAGLWVFITHDRPARRVPLDFLGFGALAAFAASFQLMLDRGTGEDWFASREIWAWALIALAALWVFSAQMLTARRPFVAAAVLRDRNFITACIMVFFVNMLMMSTMSLSPPLLQGLMGYSVLDTGLVMAPRGMGSLVSMAIVGYLIGKADTRAIMFTGFTICIVALWHMMKFDLSMDSRLVIVTGFFQGMGTGMLSVPISALAFATLPARLRPEGSSLFALVRSLGSTVGVSLMQILLVRNTQTMHASLAAHIDPGDPVVSAGLGASPGAMDAVGVGLLDHEIERQAMMVAYVNDYRFMFFITLFCMPLLLLLRKPRARGEPIHVDHE